MWTLEYRMSTVEITDAELHAIMTTTKKHTEMLEPTQVEVSDPLHQSTSQRTHRKYVTVFFEPNKYNCHDLQKRRNGIYKFASDEEVSNEAGRFFYERYCDFNTNGGAWTVIQRRYVNDQQENFNRSWSDYKFGFGDLDREFWFGNDFIHKLTFDEDMELRILIEDSTGRTGWAQYSVFKVDSEGKNFL